MAPCKMVPAAAVGSVVTILERNKQVLQRKRSDTHTLHCGHEQSTAGSNPEATITFADACLCINGTSPLSTEQQHSRCAFASSG